MSREIKFRAWDKTTSVMVSDYAHNGSYGELYCVYFHDSAYNTNGCPDLILEQFTGLLDKNGKEIYEGDIIRMVKDGIGQVIMVNNCSTKDRIVIWHEEEARFSWMLLDGQVNSSGWSFCKNNEDIMEIIGNIHENKELLESEVTDDNK